jgi:predicted RNase H-like HicB family nuclease
MSEITFIVTEDDVDGGYNARAHWPAGNRAIFTQGDTREELIANIREAVEVSFDEGEPMPNLIHLHYVRDEVVAL